MPLATVETKRSVNDFINSFDGKGITGKKPKMWGSIIGFGNYKYKRKGGKEEFEWFNIGFAPRKDRLTFYLTCYLDKEPLIKKLGKCKHGKGCLHIKKLEDINLDILIKLIEKYKDGRWFGGN
jgi:hypothetical protein